MATALSHHDRLGGPPSADDGPARPAAGMLATKPHHGRDAASETQMQISVAETRPLKRSLRSLRDEGRSARPVVRGSAPQRLALTPGGQRGCFLELLSARVSASATRRPPSDTNPEARADDGRCKAVIRASLEMEGARRISASRRTACFKHDAGRTWAQSRRWTQSV